MDFNLHPYRPKAAFTLAEVLITIGIIGVVAALLMPQLILDYEKRVTEVRLKKFYSAVNQAVKAAQSEYGDYCSWEWPAHENSAQMLKFYNKYIAPYWQVRSVEIRPAMVPTNFSGGYTKSERVLVIMNDGSVIMLENNSAVKNVQFTYIPFGNKLLSQENDESALATKNLRAGYDYFSFLYSCDKKQVGSAYTNSFVEPFSFQWNGTRNHLFTHPHYGCSNDALWKNYCSKLIQQDGWKISKDYPWKTLSSARME